MNVELTAIPTATITETNKVPHRTAAVILEMLGYKETPQKKQKARKKDKGCMERG